MLVIGQRTYPVEYTYDAQGRRRTMTTWKDFNQTTGMGTSGSAVTRWNYDPYRGWLSSKDDPDETTGQAPSVEGTGGPLYTYTPAGRLASRTWQRGVSASYAYNSGTGDLSSVTYSDSTPNLSHSYNRQGQVTATTQGSKVTSFVYDNVGNRTQESVTGGPISGFVVDRSYDASLRPTQTSLTLGASAVGTVTNAYHNLTGRLDSVATGGAQAGYG